MSLSDQDVLPLESTQLLDELQAMITNVNMSNSANAKITTLQKYNHLKQILKLIYDPIQTSGITSTQLKKYIQKTPVPSKQKDTVSTNQNSYTSLENLIQDLYNRNITGHDANNAVIRFTADHPKHESLIYKIVDKDLEIRMGVAQINKAFPNLISEFEVVLAKDFESGEKHFRKNQHKPWIISRKFDGIRCVVKIDQGNVCAYSRNGHRLPALEPLEHLIKSTSLSPPPSSPPPSSPPSCVLDGEVCVIEEDGSESFTMAVSAAKRKSVLMTNYRYYVFDMLTIDEFESQESKRPLSVRLEELQKFVRQLQPDQSFSPSVILESPTDIPLLHTNPSVRIVDFVRYSDKHLIAMKELSSEKKWEGLMLRCDVGYEGKRTNNLLKVKNFFTEEYIVEGHEVGPFRIVDPTTGLETTVETLKSVIIKHKGNQVNVGSGFSLDERQQYYAHPELIIGKTISVRYFEECTNAHNTVSLRFPTFIANHGEKRTT